MAFISDNSKNNKKKKTNKGSGITKGQGGGLVGGNQGGSSNNPQTASSNNQNQTKSSSGWTNLTSYIEANKGNDQKMAGKIQSGIDTQVSGLRDRKQGLKNRAQSDAERATVKDSGGVADKIRTNPSEVKAEDYNRLKNASYDGPQDVVTDYAEQYRNINQGLEQVDQTLENTQSQAGRETLLKDTYNRPDYNYGEQKLDSFILGASPDSKQQIETLSQKYSGLEGEWDSMVGDIRDTITGARQQTEQTSEDVRQAYDQALGQTQRQVNQAREQSRKDNNQRLSQYQETVDQLKSTDPQTRRQAMETLEINPQVGEWLISKGLNPSRYMEQTNKSRLGNYIDEGVQDRYETLLGLEGKQIQDPENFEAASGVDNFFQLDGQSLSQAADARRLESELQDRFQSEQKNRKQSYNILVDRLSNNSLPSGLLQQAGIDPKDAMYAQDKGIDLTQFLSPGKQITAGDVAKQNERKRWADLKNALGIETGLDLQDTQNEGNFVNVDKAGLQAAIAKARAADEQRRIEAAKREAERQRQQQIEQIAEKLPDAKKSDISKSFDPIRAIKSLF